MSILYTVYTSMHIVTWTTETSSITSSLQGLAGAAAAKIVSVQEAANKKWKIKYSLDN